VESRGGVFATSRAHVVRASQRVKFRRALALIVMTLIVPGSAQVMMGNKRVGRVAMRMWLGFVVVGAVVTVIALTWRTGLFTLATNPLLLGLGRWVLILGAVGWVALILDAWRLGAPLQLARRQRLWMTGLNSALCLSLAGGMFFAAHLVSVQTGLLDTVFVSQNVSGPNSGRYNVLLMGGDSGKGRNGLRPDSLTLASIDAETGRTVLVGLPRNLQDVPFPEGTVMHKKFPKGWTCDTCELNYVNTWANDNKDLFPKPGKGERPVGVQATIDAVSEITGLDVNYYAMVNLEGFSELVNAVGGVTLNVKEKTAIGGIGAPIRGYIDPGKRKLTGEETLWYARSRVQNDDFSRMGRQKCVMSAMLHQLSPQTVLMNAQAIANSSSALMTTDIPAAQLGSFMDLALKARQRKVSTVSLVPPVIFTGNPDYDKVQRLIRNAIDEAEGRPVGGILDAELTMPVIQTEVQKDTKASNQSDDLERSC
jgi:LCP family protein required for cell wall assembly